MRSELGHLEQLQRAIDFIEAHLETDLELTEVSKVARMSHWHFQRIFKAMTGETLKTYVRSRRMANAMSRLLVSKVRILDIALDAGFESQESFTRAFKDAFGMTPGAYRKLGDKNLFLQKVAFDAEYLRHINQNISLTPKIYPGRAMRLVGLRTHFFGTDSEKNNIGSKLPPLWDTFMGRYEEIEGRVPEVCYGVIRPASENSELLEYHAAVEVVGDVLAPQGMSIVELPKTTYARFEHRGPAQDIDHTVNFIYSTWLARSGRKHTFGADLEIYGPEYSATSPDSVFEYAIPIREPTRAPICAPSR